MATVCLGGKERNISYLIYEEEGEYIATVNDHKEQPKIETFPHPSPAKKWVNRMLDNCHSKQNEID